MSKYETLMKYVRDKFVGYDEEISICLKYMEQWRCGLSDFVEGVIIDAIDEYCVDNDIFSDDFDLYDEFGRTIEELFFDAIDNDICFEWCQNCETEVILKNKFVPQICPSCGKVILPCSLCEGCVPNCPLKDAEVLKM